MRSVGAIVPVWNEERFIRQHLKMLEQAVDEIVVVMGDRALVPYKRWHDYTDTPDRSKEIVLSEFPQHKLYDYQTSDEDASMMFSNIWNFGREKIHTDMVIKLDVDMFLTNTDLKKFVDFLRESQEEHIAFKWLTHSINYYRDLDHGLKDQVEEDMMAFNPRYEVGHSLDYPQAHKYFSDLPIIFHHLRGFNKPEVTDNWIEGKEPFKDGRYSTDLLKEFGNNGKWFKAPEEIKNLVHKGIV